MNCSKQATITGQMGYLDVVSRVSQIQAMLAQVAPQPAQQSAAASTASFAQALQRSTAVAPLAGDPTQSAGGRALQAAISQLGVTEQPPGSNDGPAIATYRSAVTGSYAGAPWCAYFVSWCAAQAGAPLGENGEGLGSVEGITAWAQRTGRFTATPAPGELILFGGRHVGIVKSVDPDGTINTVEGNSSDGVNRRTHAPGEATGFVVL